MDIVWIQLSVLYDLSQECAKSSTKGQRTSFCSKIDFYGVLLKPSNAVEICWSIYICFLMHFLRAPTNTCNLPYQQKGFEIEEKRY